MHTHVYIDIHLFIYLLIYSTYLHACNGRWRRVSHLGCCLECVIKEADTTEHIKLTGRGCIMESSPSIFCILYMLPSGRIVDVATMFTSYSSLIYTKLSSLNIICTEL